MPLMRSADFSQRRLESCVYHGYESNGPSTALSMEDLVGKICVDVLFTEPVCTIFKGASRTKEDEEEQFNKEKLCVDRYLMEIQKFWSELYRSKVYPEPLADLAECPKKWSLLKDTPLYQLTSVVDNLRREVTAHGVSGQPLSTGATINAQVPPRGGQQTVMRSFSFDSIRS